MKFNMNKWAESIIAADDVRILPVLFFPCLSLVGKGVIEVINDPESHLANMQNVINRFPAMIAAMTGMDLTSEAEAFGCEVHFSDTEAPHVVRELVFDKESVESLTVPSFREGRGPVFVKATELASRKITDRPVFGGMLGPFSLAAVLLGLERTLKSTVKDASTVHTLLSKCTQYSIEYAKAYKEAGANGVFLAEPTAGLLAAKQCDAFSSYYVKKIVDAVQDENFFVVLHDCGKTKKLVESMLGTGAKGYHFGDAVDMLDIMPQIPAEYLVFGNIDPTRVLSQGTPDIVREKTLELLDRMRPYPHFVLSSGCDLPSVVPVENIGAFFGALDEFNSSK